MSSRAEVWLSVSLPATSTTVSATVVIPSSVVVSVIVPLAAVVADADMASGGFVITVGDVVGEDVVEVVNGVVTQESVNETSHRGIVSHTTSLIKDPHV